jgi:WD40 repeat protein
MVEKDTFSVGKMSPPRKAPKDETMPDHVPEKPIQAEGQAVDKKPAGWRRWALRLRLPMVLVLSFAFILAVVYWIAPIRPFATWNINDHILYLYFSPDCKVLIGRSDYGPLHCWDVEKGLERFSIADARHMGQQFLFSPDSRLIAVINRKGHLIIRNTTDGQEVAIFTPESEINSWESACFSPDGAFLAIENRKERGPKNDCSITFWNVEAERPQGTIRAALRKLAFVPDGKSCATYMKEDGSNVIRVMLLRLDQTNSPTLVKEHRLEATAVKRIVFSPDLSKIAIAIYPSIGPATVEIRDMATGVKRLSFIYQQEYSDFEALSFEGNGRFLVAAGITTGADGRGHSQATLWDVGPTPKEIGTFVDSFPLISPAGDWVAMREKTGVTLFKLPTLERGSRLPVAIDTVPYPAPMSFSPDGKFLIHDWLKPHPDQFLSKWLPERINPFPKNRRGGLNGVGIMMRLWEVATGSEVISFDLSCPGVCSPDGKWLATFCNTRHIVELWSLPTEKPMLYVLGWSLAFWLFLVLGLAILLKVRKRWLTLARPGVPPTMPVPAPEAAATEVPSASQRP